MRSSTEKQGPPLAETGDTHTRLINFFRNELAELASTAMRKESLRNRWHETCGAESPSWANLMIRSGWATG